MSTAQWANIGEDAGALPALLARIPEHAAIATIDYLWIFPPRKIAIGESTVVVVTAYDQDPLRRRVSTGHFTVSRNKKGVPDVSVRFAEHGSAPESAVPRIVEGVLRRLGEDTEAAPREEQIEGEQERWNALIVDLGGRLPEETADDDVAAAADEPAASHEPAVPDEPAAYDERAVPDEPVVSDESAASGEPAVPDDPVVSDEPAAPDPARDPHA